MSGAIDSVCHSVHDWVVTIVLALWALLIQLLSAPDWVTALTVLLLLIKIVHEAFRFWQSWRRSKLKRRLADQMDVE